MNDFRTVKQHPRTRNIEDVVAQITKAGGFLMNGAEPLQHNMFALPRRSSAHAKTRNLVYLGEYYAHGSS
jgi:hypothetical protein